MDSSASAPVLLPLPVARLARRSRNAKSARERHENAWYAFEVSVRLAVAAAMPAPAGVLTRASFGQWAALVPAEDVVLEDQAVRALHSFLLRIGLGRQPAPGSRGRVSGRNFLDALAAYRNRVVGHGTARPRSFYTEAADLLAAALVPSWEAGLFLPPHSRLVWVGSVELAADGRRTGWILDLATETPVRVPGEDSAVPAGIRPGHVHLFRGRRWQDLHPWLLYEEDQERLYCFNGLIQRAQFLDFASGHCLRGHDLEALFPGAQAEVEALLRSPEESRTEPTPTPGVLGDFHILGLLGRGGMGEVHLARQQSLGRLVALKMLPQDQPVQEEVALRFQREIRALSRCEHPNVVKILACGGRDLLRYYAMELIEGVDLAEVAGLRRHGLDLPEALVEAARARRGRLAGLTALAPELAATPVSPPREDPVRLAARLFREAALGAGHLHEHGIHHRDLKPGNIMVTCEGRHAVVMDLGLAAIPDATFALTRAEAGVLGTLRYVAPEVLDSARTEDGARLDVFSLGATFWELLAGRPLREAETEADLVQSVLHGEPPPLRKVAPGVPPDLARIVEKAIARDPALRYPGPAALAEDLQAFLEDRPVQARGPSPIYRLRVALRRNRHATRVAAAALVVLAGVSAWLVDDAARQRVRREQVEQAAVRHNRAQLEEIEDDLLRLPPPVLRKSLRSRLAGVESLRRDLQGGADTGILAAWAARLEGELLRAGDRLEEAEGRWRTARQVLDGLDDPPPEARMEGARLALRLAAAEADTGRPVRSRAELATASALCEELLAGPETTAASRYRIRFLQSSIHEQRARLDLAAGDEHAALAGFREAVSVRRRLAAAAPRGLRYQHALAVSLLALAQTELNAAAGSPQAASSHCLEATALCEEVLEADSSDRRARLQLALGRGLLAWARWQAGPQDDSALEKAEEGLRGAMAIQAKLLADEDWSEPARQQSLILARLADLASRREGAEAALPLLEEAAVWARQAAGRRPRSASLARDAAVACVQLGFASLRTGHVEASRSAGRKAIAALSPFARPGHGRIALMATWIDAQALLVNVCMTEGSPGRALAHIRSLLERAGSQPGLLARCRVAVRENLMETIEGFWEAPADRASEDDPLGDLARARACLAHGTPEAELLPLLRPAASEGVAAQVWLDAGLLAARACAGRAATEPGQRDGYLDAGLRCLASWVSACAGERDRLRHWLAEEGQDAGLGVREDAAAHVRWLEQRLAAARSQDPQLAALRAHPGFEEVFAPHHP